MEAPRAGRLAGKVALVTGAGYGFGAAIVEKFTAEGANCLILDSNARNGKEVAEEQPPGTASFFHADVNKEEDWKNAVEKAVDLFGSLDIIVNNAGPSHKFAPAADLPTPDLDALLSTSLKPLYHAIRAVVPVFTDQHHGVILNISSVAALRPRPSLVWYGASKAAVNAATEGLAAELAPLNIRVNAVLPIAGDVALAPPAAVLGSGGSAGFAGMMAGYRSGGSSVIDSPPLSRDDAFTNQQGILAGDSGAAGGAVGANASKPRAPSSAAPPTTDKRRGRASSALPTGVPLGRWASATDVANAAAFLCSEEADFITGVCLRVDGGAGLG